MRRALPADPRSVSLRTAIVLACVSLICCCSGAVAVATYLANSRVILRIAEQAFERSAVETIDNVDNLLKPVVAAVTAASTVIEEDARGIAKPNVPRFLFDVVALQPQVYSAFVTGPDGRFVDVLRLPRGARAWGPGGIIPVPPGARFALRIASGEGPDRTDSYRFIATWGEVIGLGIIRNSTYDPRVRPFYAGAVAGEGGFLTDIYTFASDGEPGITFARRVMAARRLVGIVGADITLDRLSEFLAAQPVGRQGIAMIVDPAGHVVAAPPDRGPVAGGRTVREVGGAAAERAWLRSASSAPTFTFASGGTDYLAAIRRFPAAFGKDWTIVEVAPVDDFVGELKSTVRTVALFSLLVAALAGLGSLLVAGRLTRPIAGLTAEADRIRALSLDDPVTGRSRIREIQHLIDGMAAMKAALRSLAGEGTDGTTATALEGLGEAGRGSKLFQRVADHLERRRARETELSLASDIQRSVLPRPEGGLPRSGDVPPGPDAGAPRPASISARMRPAREVGGDFYDWIWRDDRRLVFVIGDVSGKGIPAALLMTSTRTAIRTVVMAGASVSEAVATANRLLSENNERCFFVTLLIGELDVGTGRLTYINAGHEPARVLRASAEAGATSPGAAFDVLGPGGPALGVIDDALFEAGTARLRPGDAVVAYTDGVVDAFDGAGESFGAARVDAVLRAAAAAAAPDIVERVFTAVDRFAGDERQFDDITCVALHYGAERAAAA